MAGDDDSALIWTRPEPGTRRPKFTRDQIASTALAIADAEGFTAVSMRRIATELGAGTMTLYYYVRTKDELIALMDDAIMAQVLIPTEQLPVGWHDALTAIAVRTWEVLMRHPWALRRPRAGSSGPNSMRHLEQSLAAVADTGLDLAGKFTLITLVDDYVCGNVLRSEIRGAAPTSSESEAAIRFTQAQLATGEFPHTEALLGSDPREASLRLISDVPEQDRFRHGLALLLDGVLSRITSPVRPTVSPRVNH